MPAPNNKLTIRFCKRFSFSEFRYLQSFRLPQKDFIFHEKNSLTSSLPHVHVNGLMIIAVKEKYVSVFLEDSGHSER